MEQTVLGRLYIKTIAAGLAAIVLCIVVTATTSMWETLVLLAGILVWFGWTIRDIQSEYEKGNITSVYARCVGTLEVSRLFKNVNKNRTYRFVDTSDNSIYIRAKIGDFRDGEDYCLLFRKSEDGVNSEKNLIAHGIVPPGFVPESNCGETSETFVENEELLTDESEIDEEGTVCETDNQDNAIYFHDIIPHINNNTDEEK